MDTKIVGYDTSEHEHRLSVLCAECGDGSDGEVIREGEEWGAFDLPACDVCGKELNVSLVSPEAQ